MRYNTLLQATKCLRREAHRLHMKSRVSDEIWPPKPFDRELSEDRPQANTQVLARVICEGIEAGNSGIVQGRMLRFKQIYYRDLKNFRAFSDLKDMILFAENMVDKFITRADGRLHFHRVTGFFRNHFRKNDFLHMLTDTVEALAVEMNGKNQVFVVTVGDGLESTASLLMCLSQISGFDDHTVLGGIINFTKTDIVVYPINTSEDMKLYAGGVLHSLREAMEDMEDDNMHHIHANPSLENCRPCALSKGTACKEYNMLFNSDDFGVTEIFKDNVRTKEGRIA